MSGRKAFYVLSLAMLGVLIILTLIKPMTKGAGYSEIQRENLLQTERDWIVQFDLVNREGKDTGYTINVSLDGEVSSLESLIPDRGVFTYIRSVRKDLLTDPVMTLTIYKAGEADPFEEATYNLKQR